MLRVGQFLLLTASFWLLTVGVLGQPAKARNTVQRFFSLLKDKQYAQLYELLPSQLQQQLTREQMDASLKRLEDFLIIEKMQIGRVQEKGEFAVVDTVIYGRLKQPREINGQPITAGRATVQQFLFKENGQWKLATADERTRAYFLKQHPEFQQQFQLTRAEFAFKQNGQWQALNRAAVRGVIR